ncbi:glycosyltransferase family 9 protein [Pedobacter sp.]|uniref:glycosyltransferase family 9 protein n=1 Tax=Pedobacter sp. TaxID=1411316 RepID=UPI00396C831B
MENNIKKIAIFRALQLGDILCAMPAIKAIREFYPQAEIIFIGLAHTKPLIERFKCTDQFVAFPGYPGLPEQEFDPIGFETFVNQMREKEIDLLFQLQGNGAVVYEFLNILGAKRVVGFCQTIAQQNEDLMCYPEKLHEIDRHLALLNHLKIAYSNDEIFFSTLEQDEADFKALKSGLKPKEYICIHPGSRGKWRQWPVAYFAAIADFCKERGFEVVITGDENETDIAHELAVKMKYRPLILTGKTSLGAISHIIENAFALIANCTGVSHIAAALKTPSIIISMDGEPYRWGPKNLALHFTIDWNLNPDYKFVLRSVIEMINMNQSGLALEKPEEKERSVKKQELLH